MKSAHQQHQQHQQHVIKAQLVLNAVRDAHTIELLLADFARYKSTAREILHKLPEGTNANETVFCGFMTHQKQVSDRLDFLRFLLQHGIVLSVAQMEAIWREFVDNALTEDERETTYAWLASIRANNGEVRSCAQTTTRRDN